MIAEVTLKFWYDDQKERRPDKWDWQTLIDSKSHVLVLYSDTYPGFPCYFCNDPINEDDIVWINTETGETEGPPTGAPFHVNCAPDGYYG